MHNSQIFGRVQSILDVEATEEILRGFSDTGLTHWLLAHPIGDVLIQPASQFEDPKVAGEYQRMNQSIRLNVSVDEAWHSQSCNKTDLLPSISSTGLGPIAAMRRTIVHEVGHHLLWIAGVPAWQVQVATCRQEAINYCSRIGSYRYIASSYAMAVKSKLDYFAESFAAYCYYEEELRERDSIGYNLVRDVLTSLGTERRCHA